MKLYHGSPQNLYILKPQKAKRTKNPIWIHIEHKDVRKVREGLTLVPNAVNTLSKLKKMGLKMVVLSVSPLPPRKAKERLAGNLEHFGILKYFDQVYATKKYPESKGEHMLKVIKGYGFKKSEALMVGDIYLWDFSSAKKVGIKAILFEHNYDPKIHHYRKVKAKIKDFKEVLKYV